MAKPTIYLSSTYEDLRDYLSAQDDRSLLPWGSQIWRLHLRFRMVAFLKSPHRQIAAKVVGDRRNPRLIVG